MSDQPTIQSPTPEEWDSCAEAYAFGLRKLAGGPYALLLNAVELEPGSVFVDVGCGPAYLAAEAVRRGAEAICVDTSEKMLELARFAVPDSEIQQADAVMLPVGRRSADAVVENFLLHLVPDPVACILDAVRVMKSGGTFAATVWRRHADNPALGLFYAAAQACGSEVPEATQAGIALWDSDTFERALNRAHLAAIEVRPIEWILRVKPDEWWSAVMAGDPVTNRFVLSHPPVVQEQIRSAFLAQMARLPSDDDEVLLPARAVLGSGRVER